METSKAIIGVDREEINYLRVTLESYDGMVMVRTVDPHEAKIELRVAPGCGDLVRQLILDLVQREGLRVVPIQGMQGLGVQGKSRPSLTTVTVAGGIVGRGGMFELVTRALT